MKEVEYEGEPVRGSLPAKYCAASSPSDSGTRSDAASRSDLSEQFSSGLSLGPTGC